MRNNNENKFRYSIPRYNIYRGNQVKINFDLQINSV